MGCPTKKLGKLFPSFFSFLLVCAPVRFNTAAHTVRKRFDNSFLSGLTLLLSIPTGNKNPTDRAVGFSYSFIPYTCIPFFPVSSMTFSTVSPFSLAISSAT